MKPILYIIIGVTLLLFASCGQQQRAKSVVKNFMKEGVADYSQVDYLSFNDVDSTRTISDSLLEVMHQHVPSRFRHGIRYQPRKGHLLFLLRTKYLYGQDTCSATFYIDAQMAGVVAFKEN